MSKDNRDLMKEMAERTHKRIEKDKLFMERCFNKPENQLGYHMLEMVLNDRPEIVLTIKVLMHSAFADGGNAALDMVSDHIDTLDSGELSQNTEVKDNPKPKSESNIVNLFDKDDDGKRH